MTQRDALNRIFIEAGPTPLTVPTIADRLAQLTNAAAPIAPSTIRRLVSELRTAGAPIVYGSLSKTYQDTQFAPRGRGVLRSFPLRRRRR